MTDLNSRNAFQSGMAGTAAREDAQDEIEALRLEGGVFVGAVRATRMAMAMTDPSLPGNPIVFANQSFLDLSGYELDEVLGQQPYFMNGAGTDPDHARRFREALEQDRDEVLETVQYRKDGSRFVGSLFLSAFKDDNGRTLHHFLSWGDVTRQVDAEAETSSLRETQRRLQESEARHLFLLELSDTLRPLRDPSEVQAATMKLVAEHLDVVRASYFEIDEDHDRCTLTASYERGVPPPPDRTRMSDFAPDMADDYRAGRTFVIEDTELEAPSEPERAAYRAIGVRAAVGVPLLKEGQLLGVFGVHSATRRHWSSSEIQLLEDVADRIWSAVERANAEAALRAREERQVFLLKLSDTLRAEPSAEAVASRALQLLSEEMRVDRCYVGIYRLEEDAGEFPHQVHNGNLPPMPDRVRLSDFPKALEVAVSGTLVIESVEEMRGLSDEDRANIGGLGMRSLIASTLRKGEGNPLWSIVVASARPRVWTQSEILLVDEVTERTWAAVESARAETRIRENEGRYRTLFEAIDSGFCILEMIFDEDGRATDYRFIEANPAFERQSGLVGALGRRIREFAPDLEEHWLERYGSVALTGEPLRIEGEVAPLGRWFDINAFRVGTPEQRRVAVLFNDISGRKQIEVALRASQQQFETLLNQAPLGVYLVDSDFVIRHVNPIAAPVFGDVDGGCVGRDFDEVIHVLWDKDYADEVVGIFRRVLETGEPYITPERAEHRSDRDVVEYYEWRLDRIILQDGQHGVVCYFRDISAQVHARHEIEKGRNAARQSEARLAAAFESVPVGVAVISTDGTVAICNQEFRPFLASGVIPSRDTERGSPWRGWDVDGRPLETKHFPGARALGGESVVPGQEMLYTGDDGREIWTSVSTAPIRDEGGTVTGAVAVISDIDDVKRSADALRESEERFRTLAESIEDVFYITDLDRGELIYLSPGYERIWGRSVASLMANLNSFADTLHPDDLDRYIADKKQQAAGELVTTEYRIICPSGEVRWIYDRSFPITDRGGRRAAGVATDITERKRAEAALAESEERLRLIVESARDYAIFTTDEHDIINDWLPGAQAVFGFSREEAEGQPGAILFTKEDREQREPEKEIETARREGKAPDIRWHVRKGGGRVFIEGQVVPLRHSNGEIHGFLKIGQDITDRQLAEEALRESEARFRQFGEASSDLLWIRNAETLAFEYLSPAFETLYGTPREWVLEANNVKAWAELIHPDDQELALNHLRKLREGVPMTSELRVIRPSDGEVRWIHDSSFPMVDERGIVERIAGIGQDVTDRKRAVELQGTLLAELQHRVRNILALIQSVVRRTLDTSDTAEDYAMHLGGRIAAMARTQAQLTRSAGRRVDLEAMLRDELLSVAAQEEQYWCEGPRVLLAPKAAEVFALAIHELATNAVKYGVFCSAGGQLEISWRAEDRDGEQWLVFSWEESRVKGVRPFKREGFGTELITRRVPYELRGSGSIERRADGIEARIEFPLAEGGSILETGAMEQLK